MEQIVNMELSIIVPVYNVEKYIRECLDSILKIKNINYEVLIINDGSPDNSQKIIDEYCKKDVRVKSFIKENGGLSSARNYGLEKAQGEYIWFVDSDDLVVASEFEKFFKEAINSNKDFILGNCYTFKDGEKINYKELNKKEIRCYDNKEKIYFELKGLPGVWRVIYKNKFLKKMGIRFKEKITAEDVLFNYLILNRTKSLKYIDTTFYLYRINREGSITTSHSKELAKNKILIANILAKDNNEKNKNNFLKKYPIELYLIGASELNERDLEVEKNLWKIKGISLFKIKAKLKLWKRTYIYRRYSIKNN